MRVSPERSDPVIRVIGADPGDTCGIALLECVGHDPSVAEWTELSLGTLTGQRGLNRFMDDALRYGAIHGLALEVPRHPYMPDPSKSRGKSFREAIAISANISIGQGARRGEIRARAIDRDIPVLALITSDKVKASLANSRSSKGQIAEAVRLRFGLTLPEHAADAVAIAYAVLKRDYAVLLARAQRKG